MLTQVLHLLGTPIMYACYWLSGRTKRNKKIWLFGAWRGQQYSDNSKYLFEYINFYHKEIRCIWLTKNDNVYEKLKNKGVEVYKGHSLKTLYYVMTAGVLFETEGVGDVPFHYFLNGIVQIMLFHGFPIKSGSKWVEHGLFKQSTKPWQNQYDKMYWMSTSDAYSRAFYHWGLFGVSIPHDHFVITGYARNDTFVRQPTSSFLNSFHAEHGDAKLICYMPTHRNFGTKRNIVLTPESLEFVNSFLKKNNIYMLLKPHFHEIKHFIGQEDNYSNIIFAFSEEFSDAYTYLYGVDLLISDYSSVMVDYLCADKPIVIFDYDLEEYMKSDAGLENSYFELEFGPRCKDWNSVLLETASLLENDSWKSRRKTALDITQKYNDGSNCERVYRATMELI